MRRFGQTLILGHVGDARDWRGLHEAGILAAVDLADDEPPTPLPRSLIALRFPLSDGGGNPRWLVAGAIAATVRLIRDRIPTLVFCSAGLSRTPSIVAAAWAIVCELDPDEALEAVTRAGPADVAPALWAEVRATLRAEFDHH